MATTRKKRPISAGIPLDSGHKANMDAVRARGAQATCFFNNKGGVGKTTLVANLGAEFALNFGAKVLVVDADPQCNLTQYVLGAEESLEIYESSDPQSVFSVIRPLSLGKGYGTSLPIRQSENFGFDIIVGDPRLAIQEDLLANDWRDAKGGGMRGIRTTYVFADLVGKAKDLGYDLVFFDMGPSLGAINRSILLAMDYFVVPMSIDIFSSWAIKNIGTAVTTWQKELRTGITLAEDPAEIPQAHQSKTLRFLGYVTQQHRERAADEAPEPGEEADEGPKRRIVQAYQDISAAFPQQIADSLGPFFDATVVEPNLGTVKHMGSIAPKSQSQHTPMISVRGTGRFVQSRKEAREIYRDIAAKFARNLALS